ncbi:hypothetical protein [Yinghuangia sp. YIM S09857]|uniref:hypothetical protein n=1 Tax=Yinghuangia sp. YIM S09857 TaxID=3436929 RepID=UPI003F531DBD
MPHFANGDSRLSFWPRVREFAVPPTMIESATARRLAGDWAGACAAAGIDVDLNLRVLARSHGHELAALVRADLRHLAPDLLRWHMPRIAPDGQLRPGLTIALARYGAATGPRTRGLYLVVRTPPGWAAAGQRISLALWDGTARAPGAYRQPHPDRRFRLDLHRHLWDARRAHELRTRAGADVGVAASTSDRSASDPAGSASARSAPSGFAPSESASTGSPSGSAPSGSAPTRFAPSELAHLKSASSGFAPSESARSAFESSESTPERFAPSVSDPTLSPTAYDPLGLVPEDQPCAVNRWAAEAAILLRAEGRPPGGVLVRLGTRHRLIVEPAADAGDDDGAHQRPQAINADGDSPQIRISKAPASTQATSLPVLPDAATWVLPDLELLRAGAIAPGQLHPLVAAALVPGYSPDTARSARDSGHPRYIDCRGVRHRIGLVDGVLTALDHHPDEIRREELLAALTGTPLPCLQAIDTAHRRPDCLTEIRERLHHGDSAGALALVEDLLGADAMLRDGELRDQLEAAARGRITYGLFRAGLADGTPPDHRPSLEHRRRPGRAGPRRRRTHAY